MSDNPNQKAKAGIESTQTNQAQPCAPVQIGAVELNDPQAFLAAVENVEIRDVISTVLMAENILTRDGRPEWVFNAAIEFWRGLLGAPKSKKAKSEPYKSGYLCSHLNLPSSESNGDAKKLWQLFESIQLMPRLHEAMAKAPGGEASDFYAGLSDGIKQQGELSPTSSAIIYMAMTIKWREVAQLNNTAAVHSWLDNELEPNLTGSRDRIAKLCQKIRFPFSDKGGRPTKPRKQTTS